MSQVTTNAIRTSAPPLGRVLDGTAPAPMGLLALKTPPVHARIRAQEPLVPLAPSAPSTRAQRLGAWFSRQSRKLGNGFKGENSYFFLACRANRLLRQVDRACDDEAVSPQKRWALIDKTVDVLLALVRDTPDPDDQLRLLEQCVELHERDVDRMQYSHVRAIARLRGIAFAAVDLYLIRGTGSAVFRQAPGARLDPENVNLLDIARAQRMWNSTYGTLDYVGPMPVSYTADERARFPAIQYQQMTETEIRRLNPEKPGEVFPLPYRFPGGPAFHKQVREEWARAVVREGQDALPDVINDLVAKCLVGPEDDNTGVPKSEHYYSSSYVGSNQRAVVYLGRPDDPVLVEHEGSEPGHHVLKYKNKDGSESIYIHHFNPVPPPKGEQP